MIDFLNDINYKMEGSNTKVDYVTLQGQRNKYFELRDQINFIISDLQNSLNNLSSVSKKVINGYSVDGVSGDDDFLDNTRKNIQSTTNYLNYTVLPAIEKMITKISDDMEKLI